MSAKDIAFEKERVKFRQEIRRLKDNALNQQKEIDRLNNIINEQKSKLNEQEEWIERLLEYTELNREEIKSVVENEIKENEIKEHISTTLGILGVMGGYYFGE